MPYSTPTSPTPFSPSNGRPNHRRSYTVQHHHLSGPTFSNEKGPGTFTSLGSLPRRRGTSKFRIQSDSSDDDTDDGAPLQLKLKQKPPSFSLDVTSLLSPTPSGAPAALKVPFPRTSPLPSPSQEVPSPSFRPVRPSVTRTNSHPTILANGKPLKSSLKSSSSTGSVVGLTPIRHARARSAPSTPRPDMLSDDDEEDEGQSPSTMTPSTPKNVHFADSLASVRVFNRSARPASVSLPIGSDFETETDDGESSSNQAGYFGWGSWSTPSSNNKTRSSTPLRFGLKPTINPSTAMITEPAPYFQIDSAASSPIPLRSAEWTPDRSIIVESLILAGGVNSSDDGPENNDNLHLSGTILVRNVSFEKKVVVRFTLDDWGTVSEVSALWSMHISALPPGITGNLHRLTLGDLIVKDAKRDEHGWDRFSFRIRLGDYAPSLASKTLFLVARFQAGSNQEFWDNNAGSNYTVRFKEVKKTRTVPDAPPPTAGTSTIPFPTSSVPTVSAVAPSAPQDHPLTSVPGATHASPSPRISPPLSSSPPLTTSIIPKLPPIVTNGPITGSYQAGFHSHPIPPRRSDSSESVTNPTAAATSKRLSKFSLSNYASPSHCRGRSGSVGSVDSAGSGGSSNAPEPETKAEVTQEKLPDSNPDANDDTSSSSSDEDSDELKKSSSGDSGEGDDVTPPTSPLDETSKAHEDEHALISTKLPEFILPELQVLEDHPTPKVDAIPVHVPSAGHIPPPPQLTPSSSGASTPSSIDSSDSLYKMFVQQWCFAKSPSGSPV
ncbi:putative phosphatase regulatory subunit-domain-containing protein [Flagelloscypha sp. PMI_526]|nr:putative phosphatase regulatory subunit-domain-containing protein [Flagelloscypha sp. PMI_526]